MMNIRREFTSNNPISKMRGFRRWRYTYYGYGSFYVRNPIALMPWIAFLLLLWIACCEEAYAQEPTFTPTPTITQTPTPSFVPTPVSRTGNWTGSGWEIRTSEINHYQSDGSLSANHDWTYDEYLDEELRPAYIIGSRNNQVALIAGATQDFYQWRSDLDWEYPARKASWTLESITFDDHPIEPDLLPDYLISGEVFDASRLAIFLDPSINRLLTRNNPGAETCTVVYRLALGGGLYVDPTPGNVGEYCIYSPDNELRFRIYRPKILNENYDLIRDAGEIVQGSHAITDLGGGGVYLYTKTIHVDYPGVEWVDADIFYASSGGSGTIMDEWGTSNFYVTESNSSFISRHIQSGDKYRAFMRFDTSAIDDGATIYSAKMVIPFIGWIDDGRSNYIHVGTQGDSLTTADWDAIGGTVATFQDNSSGDTQSKAMINISPTYINKTGASYFAGSSEEAGSMHGWSCSSVIYLQIEATPSPTPTPTNTPVPQFTNPALLWEAIQ